MPYHPAVIDVMQKLRNKNMIGGKHTEEKNLFRWLKYLPPDEQRKIREDWEQVVKMGLVFRMKKPPQFHISLNPRSLQKIEELIQWNQETSAD